MKTHWFIAPHGSGRPYIATKFCSHCQQPLEFLMQQQKHGIFGSVDPKIPSVLERFEAKIFVRCDGIERNLTRVTQKIDSKLGEFLPQFFE